MRWQKTTTHIIASYQAYLQAGLFLLLGLLLPTQLGKHFFPPYTYVSAVRIDYLAPTIYLVDLITALLFIANARVALAVLKGKNTQLLLLLLAINCLFAPEQHVAVYKFFKIVQWLLLAGLMAKKKNALAPLLCGLLIMSVIETFLALAQLTSQQSIQGLFYWLGERRMSMSIPDTAKSTFGGIEFLRPYATFSHPNVLGGFYALLLAWCLQPQKHKTHLRILAALAAILTTLSFSKAGWLSVFVALAIMMEKKRKEKTTRTATYFSILFLASTVFLMVLMIVGDQYSFEKRIRLVADSLHIIATHPVFGVGLGGYVIAQSAYQHPYPYFFLQPVHNTLLLLLGEVGVGPVLLFGLLGGLKDVYKVIKHILITRFAIVTTICITGTLDHYWWTQQQTWLLSAVVAGSLYAGRELARKSEVAMQEQRSLQP